MSGKLEENKGFRVKRGWYSNVYKQEVLQLAEPPEKSPGRFKKFPGHMNTGHASGSLPTAVQHEKRLAGHYSHVIRKHQHAGLFLAYALRRVSNGEAL